MGWLLVKKHPDVKAKGKNIDLSDLEADEIVMFQKRWAFAPHVLVICDIWYESIACFRNYYWMMPFFTFALPALLSYYVFGESLAVSWHLGAIGRYLLSVHGAWCVNSFAHYSGHKPYDKYVVHNWRMMFMRILTRRYVLFIWLLRTIAATNNTYVSVIAMGEGWHNYHHVFPWDYKTSELGFYSMNWTLAFINFFAKIGECLCRVDWHGCRVCVFVCLTQRLLYSRMGIWLENSEWDDDQSEVRAHWWRPTIQVYKNRRTKRPVKCKSWSSSQSWEFGLGMDWQGNGSIRQRECVDTE